MVEYLKDEVCFNTAGEGLVFRCNPPPKTKYKWTQFGKNFYLGAFDIKMNANKAKAYCIKEGGDLASVEFGGEQDYINSLMAAGGVKDQLTWFGLQYDNLWRRWGFTDGLETKFNNWADGEPTYPPKDGTISFLKEPCAAMNSEGQWLTIECSR